MQFHCGFVFLLYISINLSFVDANEWNYDTEGPDIWPDLFPTCGQKSQSPINIKTVCTIAQDFPSFVFSSAYNRIQNFRLTNNGHSITSVQIDPIAYTPILTGGGLNESFIFKNVHVHWGENYGSGSEHQINGQKYAGEIHFVHSNAAGTRNAVLAVFIQSIPSIESDANPTVQSLNTTDSRASEWQKYFQAGDDLVHVNDSTVISLNLSTLIGTDLSRFYRYSGSLTTPLCTENVIWTVFDEPLVLSDRLLHSFQTHLYRKTFRGPQPLYGRTVYRSFRREVVLPIPEHNCCAYD